jgi:acyl-CoA reductase-like NAD-dependent aldehyde dehydrogenase
MDMAQKFPEAVESIDPATGDVAARVACTPLAEIPEMVSRARKAQSAWAKEPLVSRCSRLRRLGGALYARRGELAAQVTRETGKPRVEAVFADVLIALDTVQYYARRAPRLLGEERVSHHNPAVKAKRGRLRREPYGVIGIITPWNYPLAIPLGQIVPAVVAGNAVVWKPSEMVPGCGEAIGQCFAEAGFPDDLLQVVQGEAAAGVALIEARPDKVIFTGRVATGRRVAEACARHLIPSVLELGGKDAMIVLADADLEAASSAAVWGSFTNCGQACLSVERVYVERAVAEGFTARCVAKTQQLGLGAGSDPENEVGPMIHPAGVEQVEAQLREAVAAGARILTGGHRRGDLGPCYFEPTVIAGVEHGMRLMREETFGPVLALKAVDSAKEAVALANDSAFGLSASVWTGSPQRGQWVAEQLRVGAVMINDVASYFGIAEAPHGGRGTSGWGRTHSRLGLAEMVQVKYVDSDRLPGWPKAWWFGYNGALDQAAGRFLDFLYAPGRWRRWSSAKGAARALIRGHRI